MPAAVFRSTKGTFLSDQYRWTYSGKVDHQISSTQNLFGRVSQEVEYRPIITAGGRVHPTNSFDFGVPRDSYVAGHTWIMSPRVINEFRVQYAYAKYEVAPPYSHGSWEPGDFGSDRLNSCTAIFNYPSLGLGGCGNSQMGPEKRWQFRDDLGWMIGDRRNAPVEGRRRPQRHLLPRRQPRLAAGHMDLPS